jgi:hypothetical protein
MLVHLIQLVELLDCTLVENRLRHVVLEELGNCRVLDTETLTDDAAAIVNDRASYTDVNRSETGVHVLVEGALPRAAIATVTSSVTRRRGSSRAPATTSRGRRPVSKHDQTN